MKHILTYFIFITLVFATGVPRVEIKLTPLAVSYEDHVLFATKSSINPTGSYSCANEKFGWLVLTNIGI